MITVAGFCSLKLAVQHGSERVHRLCDIELSTAALVRHAFAWNQGKTRFLQKKECCAGALEGRFIATLCRLAHAKTVLEVGMFTGTTTLAVAEQLPTDGKARQGVVNLPGLD